MPKAVADLTELKGFYSCEAKEDSLAVGQQTLVRARRTRVMGVLFWTLLEEKNKYQARQACITAMKEIDNEGWEIPAALREEVKKAKRTLRQG